MLSGRSNAKCHGKPGRQFSLDQGRLQPDVSNLLSIFLLVDTFGFGVLSPNHRE
jgi:hypothetical protein